VKQVLLACLFRIKLVLLLFFSNRKLDTITVSFDFYDNHFVNLFRATLHKL
jgi:hypothetical protein